MKRRSSFIASMLCLFACGGEPRPVEPVAFTAPVASTQSAPATVDAVPVAQPSTKGAALAYDLIYVRPRWVEPLVSVSVADARTWAQDPQNAASVLPATRHILVRVTKEAPPSEQASARKKIDAALKRVSHGEDFAKVAREVSEDPGSASNGGLFPGSSVSGFVTEYRTAFAALKPGEITKQPVRTQFGWHLIRKEVVGDLDLIAAKRHADGGVAARTLAEKIATDGRTKGASATLEEVVSNATVELFGASAKDALRDQSGPQVTHVGRITSQSNGSESACERTVGATARGIGFAATDANDGFLVLSAHPETESERATRIENEQKDDWRPPTFHEVCAGTDVMSDETLLELMMMMKGHQRKQQQGQP